MNPIDALFQRLRSEKRKAFMPFLTAGDPDLAFTREVLPTVAGAGASLMEIGFPFSDPIADGPVIQASYTRALAHGLHLADIFDSLKQVTSAPGWQTPLVAMASYSLIYKKGIDAFQPNVEAIAALEPDLVVSDGTNPDLLAQFDTLHIPHYEGMAAATFEDIYTQLEQLGALTGHVGAAAELVGQMQTDVEAAISGLPELSEPLTYYHELGSDLYSVTSDTLIWTPMPVYPAGATRFPVSTYDPGVVITYGSVIDCGLIATRFVPATAPGGGASSPARTPPTTNPTPTTPATIDPETATRRRATFMADSLS